MDLPGNYGLVCEPARSGHKSHCVVLRLEHHHRAANSCHPFLGVVPSHASSLKSIRRSILWRRTSLRFSRSGSLSRNGRL